MKQYMTVDAGKSFTKAALLPQEFIDYMVKNGKSDPTASKYAGQKIDTRIFRTKYEDGTFDDTEPGRATYLVEYDGKVYKVGKAAKIEAELDNSKKSFIHKLCTLFAVARFCSENETDEVVAGVVIPISEYEIVEKRNDYRDYILPLGKHTVSYKEGDKIVKKTFNITGTYVFQEGFGAIFVDGIVPTASVGVLDFGHLNVNMAIFNQGDIDRETAITTQKGANFLVSGLSQQLSSKYSAISKSETSRILSKSGKDRCLVPIRKNPEVEKTSKEFIDKYISQYCNNVMDDARAAGWSVDYMQMVAVGGTTNLIENDMLNVFGKELIIPENSNYVNAIGSLIALVARKDTLRLDLTKVGLIPAKKMKVSEKAA